MKLLVAIDGKQSADSALEYILKEKLSKETEILLIHVIAPGFADAPVEGIPDVVAEEWKEEEDVLDYMAQKLKEVAKADVKSDIVRGEIAEAIRQACESFNADQVIVPSHARQGFSRLWFGSVADEIVDSAPCTVIVLKMPQNKLPDSI